MKQYKFSVEEIKKLTKSMVILVDSREKKNTHILDYFRKQKIAYQVEKLEYGDYSFMIPAAAAGVFESFSEALDHIRTDAVIAPAEQRAEYLRGYQAYLQLYPHLKQTLHLLAQ